MKTKVALLAALLAASPVLAGSSLTDDFNGSFDLSWTFVSDGNGTGAISGNNLQLYSPTGYGAQYVGGYVAATYKLDSFVSLEVNSQNAATGNDQGIICRLQPDNSFYGLNYDPYYNRIELIYASALNFQNLAGVSLPGSTGQAALLKMQALNAGGNVLLVGQAWDTAGTTLLAQVQYVVAAGGSVPVLGAGASGVYAALNANEGMPPSPLNTLMDNFLARAGVAGDVNLDGTVSSADYTIWADNYGTGSAWSQGDLNLDGSVTSADYTIWADNYGATGSGAPVPEPATMSLLGVGVLALIRRRK